MCTFCLSEFSSHNCPRFIAVIKYPDEKPLGGGGKKLICRTVPGYSPLRQRSPGQEAEGASHVAPSREQREVNACRPACLFPFSFRTQSRAPALGDGVIHSSRDGPMAQANVDN